jgi:thymidylate kinase/cytidylate kinase
MKLITAFLEGLEISKIKYVHWKNNTFIDEALSGDDDLDILVDVTQKEDLFKVFQKFGIIKADSYEDSWNERISHYMGIDIESQKLFHIHLYFGVEIAYDYDNCYSLPIVDGYLKDRISYANEIYLPSCENEYVLLILRLILKKSITPFLLMLPHRQYSLFKNANKNGVVQGGGYAEFLDLKEKIDPVKLQKSLKTTFSFLSIEVFKICVSTIEENNSVVSFFKAGKKLKKELKNYRDYGEVTSFRKAFVRLYSIRLFSFLRKIRVYNKIYKKKPEHGGRIIAFIGGDGAGKTTTISKLKKTLKKQFALKSIHVGKPGMTFKGLILRVFSKFLSIIRLKDLSQALFLLAIAFNRRSAFKKACKLRDRGFIVLQDRIPLEGITAMDCPRVHTLANGRYKRLSNLEKKVYAPIKGVDMLFVMKLNPEIALKRRPEDDADELRIRSGQIWNNDWIAPYGFEINTGENNPVEVQKILLKEVWGNFNKPFVRTEVIGLNGTGKSSLLEEVSKKIPNTQKNINIKKFPWLIVNMFFISIFPIIKVYVKTKNKQIAHNYFHFRISLRIMKKWNKNYPAKNLILDQGPYFQAALLYKESCISKEQFVAYLKQIQKSIPKIIALFALTEVLYERVTNRKNSDGRGQHMDKKEFSEFCEEYNRSFKIVEENSTAYLKIDTSKNSLEETLKMFKTSIDAK